MEPRSDLELVLLSALRQLDHAHGYALITELRDQSGGAFDLAEGTVYPMLHRLERASLIASEWDSSGPRRRRVYRLTAEGESALTAKATAWVKHSRTVHSIISRGRTEAWA